MTFLRLTACLLALGALPGLAQETAEEPDPSFVALAAPLNIGTEGEPDFSRLTQVDGCTVDYQFFVEYGGVPLTGKATYDLGSLRLERTKVRDRKDFTNIELNPGPDAQDVWTGELSTGPEHADGFKGISPKAKCDDTGCRTLMDDPKPTLTVIGADHFARGEQVAAALDAFVAACKE